MPEDNQRQNEWKSGPVIDWLLEEGRLLPEIGDTLTQLGERLLAAGVEVERLRLSMRTLHPLMTAFSAIWERDASEVRQLRAAHGLETRSGYIGSPLEIIGKTGQPFRKKLDETLTADDHSVLHEFRDQGMTDYYGVPLHYAGNLGGILAVTTMAKGGFSDYDIKHLRRVANALAPVGEVTNARMISKAIADSYLGERSGGMVLEGKITRGHIEKIDAAIMVSDIRNWTGLSNTLPPDASLALVNAYFELIANCVSENGGEILKFIGDGVLAIFPVDGEHTTAQKACEDALKASQKAFETFRDIPEIAQIGFGIGLHFGEVLYGNVGAAARLDFTVLGKAVNQTARLEGMCKILDNPLLFSREFADLIESETTVLSRTTLKGFEEETEILTVKTSD
ncbi:MAG: adenylate/guanylate cyclase domain-containing protein [Pseudomonadota bacterium]